MQKLKETRDAGLLALSGAGSSRDYDHDRRVQDLERLNGAVSHFETAVRNGMIAMKEIASAYEHVGRSFEELTLRNTYRQQAEGEEGQGGEGDAEGAPAEDTTELSEETNKKVRALARLFATESRKMNEGQPFQTFNAGIHRDVITRLLPVKEHLKAVSACEKQRSQALAKYNKYKAQTTKIEKKYSKKGKPFCDSKSHKKFSEKRDAAWADFEVKRARFNKTFAMLMEVNDHASAQIIHHYLALNHEYLRQLEEGIDTVLPGMSAVYPLNNEYNSIQNSMIVEAVATAKDPFQNHDPRLNGEEEEDEEGEGKQRRKSSGGQNHSHHAHNAAGGGTTNNNSTLNEDDEEESYYYTDSSDEEAISSLATGPKSGNVGGSGSGSPKKEAAPAPPAKEPVPAKAAPQAPAPAPAAAPKAAAPKAEPTPAAAAAPAAPTPAKIAGAPDVSFSPAPSAASRSETKNVTLSGGSVELTAQSSTTRHADPAKGTE